MISEKNFTDGQLVQFRSSDGEDVYAGVVDYSYGDERIGSIRIQMIGETQDHIYVPVEQILTKPARIEELQNRAGFRTFYRDEAIQIIVKNKLENGASPESTIKYYDMPNNELLLELRLSELNDNYTIMKGVYYTKEEAQAALLHAILEFEKTVSQIKTNGVTRATTSADPADFIAYSREQAIDALKSIVDPDDDVALNVFDSMSNEQLEAEICLSGIVHDTDMKGVFDTADEASCEVVEAVKEFNALFSVK